MEFKRIILKISDTESEVATIPTTNDHTDGSWIGTDIYKGELFLNITDNVLQTRTESGIINLISGGSGVTDWLNLTDTPSSFSGKGDYLVKVKSDESGLEFIEDTDGTLVLTSIVGTSRDLNIGDKNRNLENDGDITITVPLNSSVAFPIGTQIFLTKKFESLNIAKAAGVIINSVDSKLELNTINSGASLLKIATDVWNLNGDLK